MYGNIPKEVDSMKKKFLWAIAACGIALALSGCGGGDKNAAPQKPKPTPTATAKIGEQTVKIYEYKGADLSGMDGKYSRDVVYLKGAVYFTAKDKEGKAENALYEARLKDETIKTLYKVSEAGKRNYSVFTDGSNIYFHAEKNAFRQFSYYDGSVIRECANPRDPGSAVRGFGYNSKTVYELNHKGLTLQTTDKGKFTQKGNVLVSAADVSRVIQADSIDSDFNGVYLKGVFPTKGRMMRTVVGYSTTGVQGKTYIGYDVGYTDPAGSCVVTDDYVVFGGGKAENGKYPYKVYNKTSGKLLGEFALDFAATSMGLLDDDDIIILSATTHKLYRMEL